MYLKFAFKTTLHIIQTVRNSHLCSYPLFTASQLVTQTSPLLFWQRHVRYSSFPDRTERHLFNTLWLHSTALRLQICRGLRVHILCTCISVLTSFLVFHFLSKKTYEKHFPQRRLNVGNSPVIFLSTWRRHPKQSLCWRSYSFLLRKPAPKCNSDFYFRGNNAEDSRCLQMVCVCLHVCVHL